MTFKPGARSQAQLDSIDHRLAAVIRRAYDLSTVDFTVVQGLRTHDEHMRNYGKGRSPAEMRAVGFPVSYAQPGLPKVTWVKHSNHEDGRAVDVYPWFDGKVQLGSDKRTMDAHAAIRKAVKAAAAELAAQIRYGIDFGDTPHYELVKGF